MSDQMLIAPSMLSADFSKMGEELHAIEQAGADWIHLDVMDGHYVPNISFGPPLIRALRPLSHRLFDVHLMISPVDLYLEEFADAGADIITIHPEAGPHWHRSLQLIKALGKKAGLALNPGTPVQVLDHVMDLVDLILIMTVNPGFGGQSYIALEEKIKNVRKRITHTGRHIDLQVDGGINVETAPHVLQAGANVLVAGSAIFKGGPEAYRENIANLRGVHA